MLVPGHWWCELLRQLLWQLLWHWHDEASLLLLLLESQVCHIHAVLDVYHIRQCHFKVTFLSEEDWLLHLL